jgi:aldose sugar dehydrogenase
MADRRKILKTLFAFSLAPSLLSGDAQSVTVHQSQKAKIKLTQIAAGLDHPWGLAILQDGRALVTERAGRLRSISKLGVVSPPIKGVPEVAAIGQGGLLDVALSPKFATDRRIYFSYAEPQGLGNGTAVAYAKLSLDLISLSGLTVIWRQSPSYDGDKHFGARIVFDREGNLFVTTGDRFDLRNEAQNPANTIGKIIHITPSGGIPANNPKKAGWLSQIWSIGHRNVQGATLHPRTGQLWTVEHGARGGDELNRPRPGKNYGWPVISYGRNYDGTKIGEGTSKPGMQRPVIYWDPSIAPSGLTFYSGRKIAAWKGNLFLGALAGQRLVRLTMDGNTVKGQEVLFEGFSRIRNVIEGPDGNLYFITDENAPTGGLYRISPA